MITMYFKKLFRIYIRPFKYFKQIKGIFIPLKLHFWCGKLHNIPMIYFMHPTSMFEITKVDLLWKDKYDTPRFERSPYISICLFKKYVFLWTWVLPDNVDGFLSDYWEQVLWYTTYCNTLSQDYSKSPDIEKAKNSWPWTDCRTNKSTWNDNYLIKRYE